MNALKPPGEGMVLFDFPPDPKTANNHGADGRTSDSVAEIAGRAVVQGSFGQP
jgi:hypothetical protein